MYTKSLIIFSYPSYFLSKDIQIMISFSKLLVASMIEPSSCSYFFYWFLGVIFHICIFIFPITFILCIAV